MNINNFPSIEQMTNQIGSNKAVKQPLPQLGNDIVSFEEILKSKTVTDDNKVVFSKHANERLDSRNIHLTDTQMDRLNEATRLATEKGIKESLVMLDDYSFIVNTKNNMVVTALETSEKNVFTNIDGAVIA